MASTSALSDVNSMHSSADACSSAASPSTETLSSASASSLPTRRPEKRKRPLTCCCSSCQGFLPQVSANKSCQSLKQCIHNLAAWFFFRQFRFRWLQVHDYFSHQRTEFFKRFVLNFLFLKRFGLNFLIYLQIIVAQFSLWTTLIILWKGHRSNLENWIRFIARYMARNTNGFSK